MDTKTVQYEIERWSQENRGSGWFYHNSAEEHFWDNLESYLNVELPSGTATYVDLQSGDGDEALAVFEFQGETFGISGSYSSWGSSWDGGIHKVENRVITINRWETT